MLRRSLLALGTVASCAALLAACNSVTGVNDLTVAGGTGSSGNPTGNGGNGGTGSGTGGDVPPAPVLVPAQGVSIQEIAIYQGVKRSLMGGTPSTSGIVVPVVAGRPALLRVFVTTDATYDKTPVTARLSIGQGPAIEVTGIVSDSNEASLGSTVNFEIPAERMTAGAAFRVDLQQPSDHSTGVNGAAIYPESGTAPLDVASDGMQLKVKLVPVKYGADGSNRLPDTSQEQIDGYKKYFFSTYPAANVEITLRNAMSWNQTIDPNGFGWGEILDAVANLRQQDKAPADVYYFGIFNPDPTFDQFCAQGCVAGLGMVGSPNDSYSRAAVGIGYPGDMAWTTAIHEIGHTQGRNHAPCGGAQGVDPGFPYKTGGIGAWGYDIVAKALIDPKQGKDLMGYCDPYWISDYTYKAIFDRMKIVNKADVVVPDALKNLDWERARVDGDGKLTWLSSVNMERPPMGEPTPVVEQRAGSATIVDGQFFPYDHLPGGVLLWPKAKAPVSGIQVTLKGKVSTLKR
ncbi:MAG: hypothetical protein QM820_35560 [Minicystis sp.]